MNINTTCIAEGSFVNISPDAFHLWATHYYKCRLDFQCPDGFSPVPYFLLCRAIELELKSRHLVGKRQPEVKKEYSHRIGELYAGLPVEEQILSAKEVELLHHASDIYAEKGFEYFKPEDALTAFSRFPDLKELDAITKNLLQR